MQTSISRDVFRNVKSIKIILLTILIPNEIILIIENVCKYILIQRKDENLDAGREGVPWLPPRIHP